MRRCLFVVVACFLFVVAYVLISHAYTHMAGLSTTARKTTCARAMGLISLPQDEAATRTLSYALPSGASATTQWVALVEGFSVARQLGRTLRLPRYAFNGTERISICQLFDVQQLPPFTNLPRSIDGSDDAICSRGTIPLSEALSLPSTVIRVPRSSDRTSAYRDLGGDWAYLRDGPSASAADAHLCISFADLAASHTRRMAYSAEEGRASRDAADRR